MISLAQRALFWGALAVCCSERKHFVEKQQFADVVCALPDDGGDHRFLGFFFYDGITSDVFVF